MAVQLWLSLENTWLNYTRNALSATGVGAAFIEFRRHTDEKPPIGGALLILMGGMYVTLGSVSTLYSAALLRHELRARRVVAAFDDDRVLPRRLSAGGWVVAGASALWPPLIWGAAVSSLWGAPPGVLHRRRRRRVRVARDGTDRAQVLVDALKAHKARLPELLKSKIDNVGCEN